MLTLEEIEFAMEVQMNHNRRKSIFYEAENHKLVMNASNCSKYLLKHHCHEVAYLLQKMSSNEQTQFIQKLARNALDSFMEANQFINFVVADEAAIQAVYRSVIEQVCQLAEERGLQDTEIDYLFETHYRNLQQFLIQTNGEAIFRRYTQQPFLLEIPCAQYTPELQLGLFDLDITAIQEPVLDIGCGTDARLVQYLREAGIEAFGIDRNVRKRSSPFLFNGNWLEYGFGRERWGTVISHMAFSNHFQHHYLRSDGEIETYAVHFRQILDALTYGGSFLYAPGLPFIEKILKTTDDYEVQQAERYTKITKWK